MPSHTELLVKKQQSLISTSVLSNSLKGEENRSTKQPHKAHDWRLVSQAFQIHLRKKRTDPLSNLIEGLVKIFVF